MIVKLKSISIFFLFFELFLYGLGQADTVNKEEKSIYLKTIRMDLPAEDHGAGGIIAADVTGNDKKDFIVTKPGHIACYENSGKKLWTLQTNIQVTKKSEKFGLPGWHGPGIQVADIDEDSIPEVLFLSNDNNLNIVNGENGKNKLKIQLDSPIETAHWEHLVIANFMGKGDRDLLLQATNSKGYRMGRYIAAFALDELINKKNNVKPLWERDDFIPCAHNGARVADLDGDGKDEILGGTIVSPEGRILYHIPILGHIDSIYAMDIRPDLPGLEVLALEEGGEKLIFPDSNRFFIRCNEFFKRLWFGGNHLFLFNQERLIWKTHFKHCEPQNATIGDFDPQMPGLEIWCRSRYNTSQKPFLFDAYGKFISVYEMDLVAPDDWTKEGVEVIATVDWTGRHKQLAVAKERHKSGDVCIFDPVSGDFLFTLKEKADRLYVADVLGDWREELIVLNGSELHIYQNLEQNPNPDRQRLWEQNHYRRSKMTWNYYNP